MKLLIIFVLILTLGCAPKNSLESGNPVVSKAAQPSTEDNSTEQDVQIVTVPSLNEGVKKNEEIEKDTALRIDTPAQSLEDVSAQKNSAEPSSPHLYEDATPPLQVPDGHNEAPEALSAPARVGIGLAWLVGGFLVLRAGAKVEDTLFRLNAVYTKLLPTMKFQEQLKIGESIFNNFSRMAQKMGLKQQLAERLAARLIVTRSATGLAVKKGFSGFFGKAVGVAKWAVPFIWGIGVLQMVLEPTELGDGEPRPADRFDFLKKNIEKLEQNPHDIYLQGGVIKSTVDHLDDVINMLEYESNQTYIAFEELRARKDISAQDKESAQKEFEEFFKEQAGLIEYFKTTYDSLNEIYYVEDSDRSKAEAILHEAMRKLEVIFAKQKALRVNEE